MVICFSGPRKATDAGIHGTPLGKSREGIEKSPLSPDALLCSSLQTTFSEGFLEPLLPYRLLQFPPGPAPITSSHLSHQPLEPSDDMFSCVFSSLWAARACPASLFSPSHTDKRTPISSPECFPTSILHTRALADIMRWLLRMNVPLKTPLWSLKHTPSVVWLSAVISSVI